MKNLLFILLSLVGVVPVWAQQSSDVNSMLAQGKDYYIHCKYDEAFKCFSQAADSGNVEAIYNVAVFYLNGYSVDKDETL